MANIETYVNTLNSIRNGGTADYQAKIPEATRDNIQAIGNALSQYTVHMNDFISTLINKISLTVISSRRLTNPLAVLKRGQAAQLGMDIEEIFIDRAKGQTYDGKSTDLLKVVEPTVKTAYHRLNRRDKYVVSICNEMIMEAFQSYEAFGKFIDGITNSLYNGDNEDEFILSKNTMGTGYIIGKVKTLKVPAWTDGDETSGKALIKAIKNITSYFKMPSNKHNVANVSTQTATEDMTIVMRSDVLNGLSVDVLSAAFNMSEVDFRKSLLEVDNFGAGGENIYCLVGDKNVFQIWDNLQRLESFPNPDNLAISYYYHHWQTYSLSPFANAYVFTPFDPANYTQLANVTISAVDYFQYTIKRADGTKIKINATDIATLKINSVTTDLATYPAEALENLILDTDLIGTNVHIEMTTASEQFDFIIAPEVYVPET